ncbi:IS5 family transposase [uncultured Bacteroides sp.]|uniref:IS5 family transposase n=1 Tax=uncultured Bacteroides sp. TaxID=162156 RepID=UPI002AAB94CE|nr:IS5 family transposase [uncultured Bacteroides sp.]
MYLTDLEETQWQVIKKILKPQERKRKYDLRKIWNAIFYVVKTGCQWRMLPSDFPSWELVYYYYHKWSSLGEFDLLLNNLHEKVRISMGQKAEASLGIMESQSVRWGNNRSLNGVDGNKKVKGIKRHVVVDKNGFLIAVMVTIACVHDSKAAYLLARCLKELCCNIKVILADAGYRGEVSEKIKNTFGYLLDIIVSGNKVNGFKSIKKRWIVERTFSWLDNNRRLCRNNELTFDSAEEMVKLANIRMLLNKI